MSAEEMIAKGGVVVWVLLVYSLLAVSIIIERFIYFYLLGRPSQVLEQQLQAGDDTSKLAGLLAENKGPEVVLLSGLMSAAASGIQDLARVASRIGSEQLQGMERGFRSLSILGNTAPLLGLLGTITGMIKAFMVIEQAGGRVDAQALAGGIWEAMLTTGVGLAVAIPILLFLHVLEGMADRRAQIMRSYVSLLIERLPHQRSLDEDKVTHHREGTHAV